MDTLPAPVIRPDTRVGRRDSLQTLGNALASAGTALVLLAVLLGVSLSIVDSSFQNRIYAGVSMSGLDLSGLSSGEAARQLIGGFGYPQSGRIVFTYGEKIWSATPEELGLSIDYLTSVHEAYAVGRTADWFTNLEQIYSARFDGQAVSPVLQYDAGKTLTYLQAIAAEIEQPILEARLELQGTQVVAYPGQTGRFVDMATMMALVAVPIGHLTDGQIPIVVRETQPQVMDASLQAEAARNLLSQDLVVSIAEPIAGDPGPWRLPPATLAEMLSFHRVSDGGVVRYEVSLDENKLTAFVQSLAGMLLKRPENARFLFNDSTGQLDLYSSASRGRALNIARSVDTLEAAVAQGQHEAALSFDFLEPAVPDGSTAAGLGIAGLLPNGEQYTSFRGSPAGRLQNIIVASEKFNGVLVAPGQVFSMADTLGNVSLDNGYSEGLIIMGNRTIKGTGGGVCQVSTTLFRAVFMTGFPVMERYAHAYRVGYYENGDGPVHLGAGFDATVFVPDVDFKFFNDSGSWILMETEVNQSQSRLYWRFYSTSDGRSVTYTSTGIRNEVDPPAPKWYPSNDVAPGKWKQIDYPVKGADVTVTRNVFRAAVLLFSDIFTTRYIPWPAQCLYNPSTPVEDGSECPP